MAKITVEYLRKEMGLTQSLSDEALEYMARKINEKASELEPPQLIPFDLEKYNSGNYSCHTRNGYPVYLIKQDLKCNWRKPLVGIINIGYEIVSTWSINGEEHAGERPSDLFLMPLPNKPVN